MNAVRSLQPPPPQRHPARRRPRLQRLLQHPVRRGPAPARRGGRGRRGAGNDRAPGADLRRGPGGRRHRRPDRDRPRERRARRLLPGAEAAGRQHRRRGGRSCAAAMPGLRGVPPNVKLTVSFDQSAYIRAAIALAGARGALGRRCSPSLVILLFLVQLVGHRHHRRGHPALHRGHLRPALLHRARPSTSSRWAAWRWAWGGSSTTRSWSWRTSTATWRWGGDRRSAVLAAAQEVAMPIFVSTITTIVVFFPVVFLTGVARNLFIPLALTIAFALMMSFLVSRTVTPHPLPASTSTGADAGWAGRGSRAGSPGSSTGMDEAYARVAALGAGPPRQGHRRHPGLLRGLDGARRAWSGPSSSRRPTRASSRSSSRRRSAPGSRRTEDVTKRIEQTIREALAPVKADGRRPGGDHGHLHSGLPQGRTALFTSNTGPHSGQPCSVNLVPHTRALGHRRAGRRQGARRRCATPSPGCRSYFFVGGIVKRILNFGAAAPIDVEIVGYDLDAGSAYAKRLLPRLRGALRRRTAGPCSPTSRSRARRTTPSSTWWWTARRPACWASPSSRWRRPCWPAWSGNTQFAPVPFTDPKTGNQYFINVRLDDAGRDEVQDLTRRAASRPPTAGASRSPTSPRCKRSRRPGAGQPQVPAAHRRRDRQHRARRRTWAPPAPRCRR